MKVFSVALLVLIFVVLHSECSPRHDRKTQKSTRQHSLNSTLSDVGGRKRFIGLVTAAFSAFNNIASFMGNCNNVVGWFDNINRFLGSGGTEDQNKVTLEKIEEVKDEINRLTDKVEDGFQDVLSGQEYCSSLISLAPHINNLRIVDHLQTDYLDDIERYRQDLSVPDISETMQYRKEKWYNDVDHRLEALKDALIILHESICQPLYSDMNIFEAYANKIGEQEQGGLVKTMEFITEIRTLESGGYGVWKSHMKEKYGDGGLDPNPTKLQVHIDNIDDKIKDVAKCEDPAIASAFTSIIDHQGTPSFGLIEWSHPYKYKTYNTDETKYSRCMAVVGEKVHGKPCQTSDTSQQWKLLSDNTLRPKSDENKCLFLVQPQETDSNWGYYVLPCSTSNKKVKTFKFEYLTHHIEGEHKLHTFFKIQTKYTNFATPTWKNRNFCLSFRDSRHEAKHNTNFVWKATIEPCSEHDFRDPSPEGFGGYMGTYPPRKNDFGWFSFRPVE